MSCKKAPIIYARLFFIPLLLLVSLTSCHADWKKDMAKGRDVVINGETFDQAIDLVKMIRPRQVSPYIKTSTVTGDLIFIKCVFNGLSAFKQVDHHGI